MSLGNNPDELLRLIRSKWSDLVAEQMWGQNGILVQEARAKKPIGLGALVTQEDIQWKGSPRGATLEEIANITLQLIPFKSNPKVQALVDRVVDRTQNDFEQQMADSIGALFRAGRSAAEMNTTTFSNTQEQSTALTRERFEEAYRALPWIPRGENAPLYFQGAPIISDEPTEDFGEGAPIEAVGYYEGVDGGMTIQEIIEKWKKKGDQNESVD